MSKINQIESALKEIDGSKFQKLADSYIHKKGYQNINPIGSVIGADKVRKGTPDSYMRQDNGKLVFAEFTTEQNNLSSKLKGDLGKCLDALYRTKIRIADIVDKYGVLAPSAHSRVASRLRAVLLAYLAD